MIFGRKNIDEVFTPRNPTVNNGMYIPRQALEKGLFRSVTGSMHSFLFGESGTGKSWLYKKVFKDKGINYVIANCASASMKNSITGEIYSVCIPPGTSEKTGYKETKKAGFSAGATAEISHEGEFQIVMKDGLLKSFEELHRKGGGNKSVIVVDNVETIVKNEKLMSELSDIIILLDDERYARCKVKLLIVGVPNEVIRYYSAAKNRSSVGNRIEEIERVTGFDSAQVYDLVERGFNQFLKVKIPELQTRLLSRHIYDVTLGVPQRVHEYCECLAYEIEDNDWLYSNELLEESDKRWLLKGLRECYSTIEKHLNSDETSEGRRNQVIYSLGQHSIHQIDTNKVGEIIRKEFPSTAPESNSGIGQILAHLSKDKNAILHPISNSNYYSITDPRYIMCIRVMLYKEPGTEIVKKKAFKIS